MRAKEIRTMDDAAVNKELHELLREQFNLRMQRATGQLANNARIRTVRRDIARIRKAGRHDRGKKDSSFAFGAYRQQQDAQDSHRLDRT
jgi:large subunit ribosomal protein L29